MAKILFGNTPREIVEAIRAKLPCDCRVLTFNDGDLPLADIVAPGVSKAWALRELLSRYDMTMADVIAFGDDSIDIEMLCESGLGVAMGNALSEVKAAADYVTLSNDEDGVAEALERLICNHR